MKPTIHVGVVSFLLVVSTFAASPSRKDIDLITSKVDEFSLGKSIPGVLELQAASSRELLTNEDGKVFGAIGLTGTKGRVAAFAHGSFLKPGALMDQAGVKLLVANTIRWAGRSTRPSVGLSPSLSQLEPVLTELGMTVREVEPEDLINQVDVYCFIGHEALSEKGVESVRRFALKGSGVIIAATPWPFGDKFPDFATFPGNQVGSLAGITFQSSGYASVRNSIAFGPPPVDSSGVPLPIAASKKLAQNGGKSATPQLIKELKNGYRLKGEELDGFLEALAELDNAIGPIVPTKENPVIPGQNELIDTVIELIDQLNQTLPAEKVRPIAAAQDYPGAVPEDAPRVTRTLAVDCNYKGWLSGRGAGANNAKEMRPTGLYAVPGETVRVTVPGRIAGSGFEIVIGAYRGGLNNRDKWQRWPRLQRSVEIKSRETTAANGLGGLITIRVPRGAEFGEQEIQIEGAIEAPLYVHGQTSVSDWKSTLRKHPAPWAELASERMIIALPCEYIRNLNNPDEVMEVWNAYIDTAAELVVVDRDDYRAERIVFDRQTAAGSMHSGYPVAAHLGKGAEQAVDASSLKRDGNWGFFHEYGHNHQHNLWSLPGTGETTCNLWSVYIFEEYVGKHRDKTHGGVNPLKRQQLRNAYFNGGRNFQDEWAVWTALDCYLLIQEEFGWEPFKAVFDEYNNLPQDEWPKSQQEKNDQWVIRLSKACNANLAPYYAAWNLPMSEFVSQKTSQLPAWDDHPVKRYIK